MPIYFYTPGGSRYAHPAMMLGKGTEAGDTAKGFRLQRLRAVELLLQALIDNPDASVLVAVEFLGDVCVEMDGATRVDETKEYTSVDAFTFVSRQVRHALAEFLQLYIYNHSSPNLRFGFYTNVNVGKEKRGDLIENLGVTLPKEGILHSLVEDKHDDAVLAAVRAILIHEVEEAAKKHSELLTHVAQLTTWSDEQWREFLGQIRWYFGEADQAALWTRTVNLVKSLPEFDTALRGKEEAVVSRLVDLLEQRQAKPPLNRYLGADTVRFVLGEARADSGPKLDPLWKHWEQEQSRHAAHGDTSRSLDDKLRDALDEPESEDAKSLREDWSDHAAFGHTQWQETAGTNGLALRVRVLTAARQVLRRTTHRGDVESVEVVLEKAWQAAHADVVENMKRHGYEFGGPNAVRNTMASLFDQCFLDLKSDDDGA